MFAYNQGIHEDKGINVLHINIASQYIRDVISMENELQCTEEEVLEAIDEINFHSLIIDAVRKIIENDRCL